MIVHEGLIAAFNYAVGPTLIYEGTATLDVISKSGDPFIVIVPDTIPLKQLFTTDTRRVRGFVLAHCEKDSVFSAFVITQRRAAVRCVPGILDDIKEGRLKNGDLIAVDGVNGKVFVQPDKDTIDFYESMRGSGQPEITKEHLPRLGREAMQTANVPEIPPLPPIPDMPEMMLGKTWPGMEQAAKHMPPDMPTPADIRREVQLSVEAAKSAHQLAKLKTWHTVALVAVCLFRDKPLDAEEHVVLENAVAEEIARLDVLHPPPPPKPASEKSRLEKWGLTPLREGEKDPNEEEEDEEPAKRGRSKPASSSRAKPDEKAEAKPEATTEAKGAPAEAATAQAPDAAAAEEKPDTTKSAAESRRAQREAEIAKARAARSSEGGKDETPKKE